MDLWRDMKNATEYPINETSSMDNTQKLDCLKKNRHNGIKYNMKNGF